VPRTLHTSATLHCDCTMFAMSMHLRCVWQVVLLVAGPGTTGAHGTAVQAAFSDMSKGALMLECGWVLPDLSTYMPRHLSQSDVCAVRVAVIAAVAVL
jgi:hypothetical protein